MISIRWKVSAAAAMTLTIGAMAGLAFADDAPVGNIKMKPLSVDWQYSRDGGQTFAKTAPAGAPANKTFPCVMRGTFQVAEPEKIAGLWVRIAEAAEKPRAAICTGDLVAASGGYWKDLGFCPTLLNARVLLNGKPVPETHGPMLYFWMPIEGGLHQGVNTIELRGDCYTYWLSPPAAAITARLIAAEPQPAAIYNGPQLGDFGDGYFTLACRTQLPADVTVEATPLEPAGKSVSVTSPKKIWHRIKIEIPKNTRAVSYTLTAKVGAHETRRGPFTMHFPGPEFRFVMFGNVHAHPYAIERWDLNSKRALKMNPAFVVNTGNLSEQSTWEFEWESRYCAPAADLLSSVPTLFTPCNRDFGGAINEFNYTPAADGYSHNWSKTIGPLRIIGLDGNDTWAVGGDNYQWLEIELKQAREKFVFVLESYPGYSSGASSRRLNPWLKQARDVILPLLAKYKATAMLSGWDPDYERCEPSPDRGCTEIISGAMGKEAEKFSGTASRLNPIGQGKGHDWAGSGAVRSLCVFDVKRDRVELKALELPDDPNVTDFPVLDKKTFRPR